MPPDSAQDQISESHEERIQRLEGHVQTLVGQSTEALLKIDFVGKQVQDGSARLAAKLDHVSASLTSLEPRLVRVEIKEAGRSARVRILKKLMIPILLAAGTGLATHFGEAAWTWFNHK